MTEGFESWTNELFSGFGVGLNEVVVQWREWVSGYEVFV